MSHANHEQTAQQTPEWAVAVNAFLGSARAFPDQNARSIMRHLCLQLVRDGSLDDFGEMQAYLRENDARMQLVATPFEQQNGSDLRCVDMQTLTPQSHWLDVAMGESEMAAKLGKLGRSQGANEAALAHATGILVEIMPSDFAHAVEPNPFSAYEIPYRTPTRTFSIGARTATCASLIRIVA